MKDPFHDLRHNEAGASSHIRLISEGGSSHARSPELVCIDSIQATHTCSTESQHTVYRSATACSSAVPAESSLCCLPAEDGEDLDRELIPEMLRHRLERLGIALSPGARVSVRHAGRLWCVKDEDRAYSVRKLAARLAVYLDL